MPMAFKELKGLEMKAYFVSEIHSNVYNGITGCICNGLYYQISISSGAVSCYELYPWTSK